MSIADISNSPGFPLLRGVLSVRVCKDTTGETTGDTTGDSCPRKDRNNSSSFCSCSVFVVVGWGDVTGDMLGSEDKPGDSSSFCSVFVVVVVRSGDVTGDMLEDKQGLLECFEWKMCFSFTLCVSPLEGVGVVFTAVVCGAASNCVGGLKGEEPDGRREEFRMFSLSNDDEEDDDDDEEDEEFIVGLVVVLLAFLLLCCSEGLARELVREDGTPKDKPPRFIRGVKGGKFVTTEGRGEENDVEGNIEGYKVII